MHKLNHLLYRKSHEEEIMEEEIEKKEVDLQDQKVSQLEAQ